MAWSTTRRTAESEPADYITAAQTALQRVVAEMAENAERLRATSIKSAALREGS